MISVVTNQVCKFFCFEKFLWKKLNFLEKKKLPKIFFYLFVFMIILIQNILLDFLFFWSCSSLNFFHSEFVVSFGIRPIFIVIYYSFSLRTERREFSHSKIFIVIQFLQNENFSPNERMNERMMSDLVI